MWHGGVTQHALLYGVKYVLIRRVADVLFEFRRLVRALVKLFMYMLEERRQATHKGGENAQLPINGQAQMKYKLECASQHA